MHTKLPWNIDEYGCVISGEKRNCLDSILVYGVGISNTEEANANAALIVKAVNCHHELVAALEDVKRRIEESDSWWMDEPSRGGFDMDIIEEALAKAKP